MDLYVIVLRIIHIFGGVFWAGTNFLLVGYVGPAVAASGPEGGKFMQSLLGRTRFLTAVSLAGGLNVLSGYLLYWRASGGLRGGWITTGAGMALTVGGLAAVAALIIGMRMQNHNSHKLVDLGRDVQAAGGTPTQEQGAQMQAAQQAIARGGQWSSILLIIAILGMATAQYLNF